VPTAATPNLGDTVVSLPTSGGAAANGNGHESVPSNVTRLRDTAN
jgi:hypothetical protein